MAQNLTTVRERIQAQGFCGLSDATYAQINYPLRLSPAICMTWAAVGTALASPAILWALASFAVLGAVLPGHPFDVLYNYGLRHLVGKPMLPRYGKRRRMACVMGAITVGAAGWAFQAGIPWLGFLLGGLLVGLAFVNVSTGFCVPSFVARVLFGKVVCAEYAD
jgi:hypothetical protein